MPDLNVLVVDDHTLVREMLGDRLGSEPGLRVVGDAHDAEEAMAMARRHRPDIIVMDIEMPGLISFDAARSIATMLPDARIIFLSAFTHDHYIDQALEVGARGYVTKGEPITTLVTAIREVARDGAYFSEDVRSRILFDADGPRLSPNGQSRVRTLTRREVEVLRYLSQGLPKKAIADTMSVSVKTVESHTEKLMRKLAIHDRVELARFAFREGIAAP